MKLGVIAALAMSVVSSVSLVIVNKYLITNLQFPYVTLLTSCHMFVTAIGLDAARAFRFFDGKTLEMKPKIQFAVLNGVSIGFLNLSLAFNSVGFYQMTKLAIIPFTVLLQTLFYSKSFSLPTKLALVILLMGVGVATVTDVQLNFRGSVASGLALITTCVAQIWTASMQKTHNISSTQLLHTASPYMALTLLICGIPVDHALAGHKAQEFVLSIPSATYIVASCIIAVCVNFSSFLVLGKCDAVTYQVLGHLKTMLILLMGFLVLQNPATARNIGGIVIALVGMIAYAHQESKEQAKIAAAQASSGGGGAPAKAAAPVEAVSDVEAGKSNKA